MTNGVRGRTVASPGARLVDQRVADRALPHPFDGVRAMTEQAARAVASDRDLHAGAPSQAVLARGRRLDLHRPRVDAAEPGELLAQHLALQLATRGDRGVLPVAAAAPARHRERARRRDPICRGLEHVDGVGPQEAPVLVGDPRAHPLPRQRAAQEDDPAIGCVSHAITAGRRPLDGELEQLRHPVLAGDWASRGPSPSGVPPGCPPPDEGGSGRRGLARRTSPARGRV